MLKTAAERRGSPRYPLVLAAEIVELPRGARLHARTSDVSRTGCYIDTLNPIPQGSKIRLRLTHDGDVFEALGVVVYASPLLGMGIAFSEISLEQKLKLDSWLNETDREF
jgi:PilZ domain